MKIKLLMALGILLAVRPGMAAEDTQPEPELNRDVLEKWLETKRLVSKEKQDWLVAEAMMSDRVALMEQEVKMIKDKTAETQNDIGDADKKLEELQIENEALKKATAGLNDEILLLEKQTLELLRLAPAPIGARVKPLSQRIPTNPGDAKITISERFQNIIGIINEINKSAVEISESVEVRELQDGSRAEVTVLYIGMGQAYYCNENGGVAGVGYPGPDGWLWEAHNDKVQEITDLIAISRASKTAAYIKVPAQIYSVKTVSHGND